MDTNTLDDQELKRLVRLAQEGDTAAFGQLYDLCFPAVYRYAAFRLPKEAAEDAVAETFIKAWEKLHTYKVHKSVPFAAWLFRIARYTIIDVYRTQRHFEEVSDTFVDEDVLNRADTATHRNAAIAAVRTALNQLPKRYKEVLLLTFVGGLPHSAAAKVLHTTEGGVRILKLRALRKLEGLLPPGTDPSA